MSATATLQEHEEIVHRLLDEVVTGGGTDLIDELLAEDVIGHAPLGNTRGRDGAPLQLGAVELPSSPSRAA